MALHQQQQESAMQISSLYHFRIDEDPAKENKRLADSIIEKLIPQVGWGEKHRQGLQKIVHSKEFLEDPVACMIHYMLDQSKANCSYRDDIVKHMPMLFQKLQDPGYLIRFAEKYFDGHPDKGAVMECFKGRLEQPGFQQALGEAVEWRSGYILCEGVLPIFPLSERLDQSEHPGYKVSPFFD